LLYALSKLKHENVKRIAFNDAVRDVKPLIERYKPSNTRSAEVVLQPFKRLESDIWQIDGIEKNRSASFRLAEARDQNIEAGFSDDVLAAFRSDPNMIDIVALNLLGMFPPSLHSDICNAVGLYLGTDENHHRHDPRFRMEVFRAYHEQCCVCKYDIKMNGADVTLEAAHIKMYSAGGPDKVNNGLLLCAIHHRLFDLGAITLNNSMKIWVSESIDGNWGEKLKDEFHEKEISYPREDCMLPKPEYIQWHNRCIFKGNVA